VPAATLVDSNVILDVLSQDPSWSAWSSGALALAADESILVINPVIYAEVSVGYDTWRISRRFCRPLVSGATHCRTRPGSPPARRFDRIMSTDPNLRLTPEEYLRIERAAEWKSEYIDGEMYAMAGASPQHALIAFNLGREFGNQLLERPCVVYGIDVRLATDPQRHYTYPDVIVVRDPPQYVDTELDTLTNPTLVAEVLSESTEKYDRGGKAERYRAIPSLSEYLLVAQDRVHVELYTRRPDGAWVLREWNDPAEEIELVSVRCRLKIAGIYSKVSFSDAAAP